MNEQVCFSASKRLRDWLKVQRKLWGLPRATAIRLILEHRAENYPKGEPTPPARREKT